MTAEQHAKHAYDQYRNRMRQLYWGKQNKAGYPPDWEFLTPEERQGWLHVGQYVKRQEVIAVEEAVLKEVTG